MRDCGAEADRGRGRDDETGGSFGPASARPHLAALGVAVYTTDADGRLTFYNERAAMLWGFRPRLGKDLSGGPWRLFWPDGREIPAAATPMMTVLRDRHEGREAELVAERADGTRVDLLAYPSPLIGESGEIVGAINVLVEIGWHKRSEELAKRLASIVATSRDAIISKDLCGTIRSWNDGAERLFGYTAKEAIGQPGTILIPPERRNEEPEVFERIRRSEMVEPYATVRRRKDGSLVDISLTVSPIIDADGRVVGASKIARDLTDQVRAGERRDLLLREMNHRVKNVFALAGGLVSLCARVADSPSELATTVREKLAALARAHQLTLPNPAETTASSDTATDLRSLMEIVVSPFMGVSDVGEERVVFDGPFVAVKGGAVASIALLMHELATNAAKYGALSSHSGRVEAHWTVDDDRLRLTWMETGGPEVLEPTETEGFGSLLARVTLERQLSGEMSREWNRHGLVVRMGIPRAQLSP